MGEQLILLLQYFQQTKKFIIHLLVYSAYLNMECIKCLFSIWRFLRWIQIENIKWCYKNNDIIDVNLCRMKNEEKLVSEQKVFIKITKLSDKSITAIYITLCLTVLLYLWNQTWPAIYGSSCSVYIYNLQVPCIPINKPCTRAIFHIMAWKKPKVWNLRYLMGSLYLSFCCDQKGKWPYYGNSSKFGSIIWCASRNKGKL